MKNLSAIILTLTIAACSSDNNKSEGTHSDAVARDTVAATTPAATEVAQPMDSAAMAKAWEQYMTPGAMHKMLSASDGKWNAEIVFRMGADAPPTPPTKVSVENRSILGGRYQESVYKGKMDGMDFEGRGVMGYDNAAKRFVSSWIDNMGTGLMYMTGTYEADSRSIVLTGTVTDPLTGKEKQVREVLKTIDDNKQTLELYDTENGREYKSMEITLTRR